MTIEQAFGKVVRRLRTERAMSQECLAMTSSLDRTYISLIECGRKNPTLESISRCAIGLNVPLPRLFIEIEVLMAIVGGEVGHERADSGRRVQNHV